MRFTLCILFFSPFSFAGFGQTLTSKEKAAFDQIAYHRPKVDEYKMIVRWASPIKYIIYGDTSKSIQKQVAASFSELQELTNLPISKALNKEEANFVIAVSSKNETFSNELSKNIFRYTSKYGGFYFVTNDKFEIVRAEVIVFPQNYRQPADCKSNLFKNTLKCFGLVNLTDKDPYSLFSNITNTAHDIKGIDKRLIEIFYHPNIKIGMTKNEVDAILTVR